MSVIITNMSKVFEPLMAGREYRFRVRSINSAGCSKWSAASESIKTLMANPPAPPVPSITSSEHDAIIVHWARPDFDGGMPITGYGVRWAEAPVTGEAATWVELDTDTTELELRIDGLKPAKHYIGCVRARNVRGASDWSGTH